MVTGWNGWPVLMKHRMGIRRSPGGIIMKLMELAGGGSHSFDPGIDDGP